MGFHQLENSIEMVSRELTLLRTRKGILATSDAYDACEKCKDPDTAMTSHGQKASPVLTTEGALDETVANTQAPAAWFLIEPSSKMTGGQVPFHNLVLELKRGTRLSPSPRFTRFPVYPFTRLPGYPGSLYPSLHRLERKGLLKDEWASTDTGREARVYRLTMKGRHQLNAEIKSWDELSTAISLVLGNALEAKS